MSYFVNLISRIIAPINFPAGLFLSLSINRLENIGSWFINPDAQIEFPY